MFPIRDDNPSFSTPVVTIGIILANVAVWVLVQGMGAEQALPRSLCELGLIPAELFQRNVGAAIPMGRGMACLVDTSPNYLTPLTSMFLHGGWLHLIGNMWFLWVFGNNVEDSMGRASFLCFYLLCGLAAAAAQAFSDPSSPVPMVGASGAIGGVLGAYVILYPRVRVHLLLVLVVFVTTIAVPAWVMLGYWALLQLLGATGAADGTAYMAHVGGFVAGGLLVWVFRDRALVERHRAFVLSSHGGHWS